MDFGIYEVEAEAEASHWWFVGRRRLFEREMAALGLSPEARVLDIGTSTGANLRLLRDLGFRRVTGLDTSPLAIAFCESKGLGPVARGDAAALPFPDSSFDFVLATDILEHVPDDRGAAREIRRVLAPGGCALITVPAFMSLWSQHDEKACHLRRYTRAPLLAVLRAAGLRLRRSYYFNFLLFAPIWLARRLIALLGIRLRNDAEVNTPLLNRVLGAIFALDVALAPRLRPPFGVSILALVEKPREG